MPPAVTVKTSNFLFADTEIDAASLAMLDSAAAPGAEAGASASVPRISGTRDRKCWVCGLANDKPKLPRDDTTIRLDFGRDGRPILPTGLSLAYLQQLGFKVTQEAFRT